MAKIKLADFEKQISSTVAARGREYFKQDLVNELDEFEPDSWTASVTGSHDMYEVSIDMDGNTVESWSCDCPYEGGPICKHVAATLFAIRAEKSTEPAVMPARAIPRGPRPKVPPAQAPTPALNQPPIPKAQTPAELLQAYDRIEDETSKRLLRIASLIWEQFTAPKLADVFNHAGFRHQGGQLVPVAIHPWLKTMEAAGFLRRFSGDRYSIHPGFAQLLCDRDMGQHPDFEPIIEGIRKKIDFTTWYYQVNAERSFREMRFARYQNKADAFEQHFSTLANNFPQRFPVSVLLEFWIGDQYDAQKLASLPFEILDFLLQVKVNQTLIQLKPPDPFFYHALEHHIGTERETGAELAYVCLHIFLLQGNWIEVGQLRPFLGPLEQTALDSVLDLLGGEVNEALESFGQTTKALRKTTKNPKAQLGNMAAAFYAMALFHNRNAEAYTKAEMLLKANLRNSNTHTAAFHNLETVLTFLKGEKQLALEKIKSGYRFEPFIQFIHFLCAFWIDPQTVNMKALTEYRNMAKTNGYRWIAAEMGHLIGSLKPGNADLARETEDAIDELSIEPLAGLLPRIESWETALEILDYIGASKRTIVNNNTNRLVWILDLKYHTLLPKEQVFGKNGWSLGRSVTFQRLKNNELNCITLQDQRIIHAAHDFYGSEAHLDLPLLKAVAGHPLLFLSQSPQAGIQLIEEKPTLIARAAKGGFELQFSHAFNTSGAQIIKETPTRYKLLEISPELAKIARAFEGQSLFVPERGSERLKKTLESLADIVPVQSTFDADDETLPTVPPDSRICVHLLPVGDGFHVELFVKPFTETPPYFKPGDGQEQVVTLVGEQKTRSTRDLAAELKNEKALRKQVEVLAKKPKNNTWELADTETCLRLLTDLEPLLENKTILLEWPKGEKFRISKLVGPDAFQMEIAGENDWFSVSGKVQVDENKVMTMQELLALSQQKGQFVELSPGKFLALTNEFRKRLASINGLFIKGKGNTLRIHPLAASALEPFTEGLKNFKSDKQFKENQARIKTAFSQQFKLPKQFNASLRPYQQEGYEWLQRCAAAGLGACLADDMGLGKTVQALALLIERGADGPALVVAPASVCRNWEAETIKFAPTLRPILFGEGDRAVAIDQAGKNDLIIVTYDLLARESEHFIKKHWTTLLLDEAQSIKNRTTKRSETAMQLQGDFRMIMTGTPLENHLGELWNLFQFINPGLLGSIDHFNEQFALPIEKYRDENRRDQLKRLVQPFILRRRKNDVLKELPAKTEITLAVTLSPEERAFYEALRRNALQKLEGDESGGGEKHLRILAEIMRLRRAACHPKLADATAGFKDSSKLNLFGEIVDELLENGHKALVFSQFVNHLEILQAYLDQKKIAYQYLDGSTPLNTRQKRIQAFQAGEGDLFLISLKAGGVGLNLTAADYVIHMDPWWNPAVEDQATDRAHRIGQEKPVTVYRLVAEDTIEEKILKLHERKRDLADSLLEGADISAKLSADDLLDLMKR
jgi:superfamily II DNA or RNA helicase